MATLIFDGRFIHETRITDLKFIEKLMQTNKKGDINEKKSIVRQNRAAVVAHSIRHLGLRCQQW
jgi:hypothetical protein